MPYRNKEKYQLDNAYYHIYNRGYEQRDVFRCRHDFNTFIYLMRKYLDSTFKPLQSPRWVSDTYSDPRYIPLYNEVELIAYCLMSNHYHLLVQQHKKYAISRLISRIAGSYSRFYNEKYQHEGSVWRGVYRAVLIQSEHQLFETCNYIHKNPIDIVGEDKLEKYPYSSLSSYLGHNLSRGMYNPEFVKSNKIMKNRGGKNKKGWYLDLLKG